MIFYRKEESEPLASEGNSRLLKDMEDLLKYAVEHGMINVSYSEVFDEWNDRRLPICGDFLRYGRILYEIYKIFNCKRRDEGIPDLWGGVDGYGFSETSAGTGSSIRHNRLPERTLTDIQGAS